MQGHDDEENLLRSVALQNAQSILLARQRAEDSLRKQTEWLRITLASIGDAVISTDVEARVTFLNPEAERLTGWGQAEATGRHLDEIFQIVNEATRARVPCPVRKVLDIGHAVGLGNHTLLIARDGTERPIDDSASPIRDESGKLIGVVLVFRDITEKHEAAKRLRESEEHLKSVFDSAAEGLCVMGPDRRCTYMNPAGAAMLGYRPEELVGRSLHEVVHHRHPDGSAYPTEECQIARAAQQGAKVRVDDEVFWHEDGRAVPVIYSASPMQVGGKNAGAVVTFRDITDRKRAEEQVRRTAEANAKFRAMFEQGMQFAGILALDGTVVEANRLCLDACGFSREEIIGRPFWECGWWNRSPALMEMVRTASLEAASGRPFRTETRYFVADGSERFVDLIVAPVTDDDGRVLFVVPTGTDITERKRAEAALREAKREAEEANNAKTQFLAVLSHELRTPLNPILLAVTAMLERPEEPEQLRTTLEMIRHNVNLQARLIDDLLDVMRIVRGKMPLHWEVADGHRLIDQAIQVCRSEILGKGLRTEVDLAAHDHHLNVDPARMQQVFWNLIKNAVKFTPAGGTITIRTRNEGDRRGRLVVEMSDTGIGIEPEVLPLIFDPFQQGETTITRSYGGLGLGLAICQGIVDAHGGTLVAESAGKDRGSTFRVVLEAIPNPAVAGQVAPDGESQQAAAPPPTSLRILVVEDEPATQRLMARLLRGLGHVVLTAGTIATTLETLEAGTLDLIVSDIGLPDGSGLDLMRRVVSQHGAVPAIALTGYGMEDDIRRSREAGFTAHLTKPIDFSQLEAMIRQVAR